MYVMMQTQCRLTLSATADYLPSSESSTEVSATRSLFELPFSRRSPECRRCV